MSHCLGWTSDSIPPRPSCVVMLKYNCLVFTVISCAAKIFFPFKRQGCNKKGGDVKEASSNSKHLQAKSKTDLTSYIVVSLTTSAFD